MKSDHRHELKTNELADWLTHLPAWAQQNRTNLLAVAAVIVLAIIVYFWSFYRSHVVSVRNQERLTLLVSQVPEKINEAMRASMENKDQSLALASVQEDLKEFADDLSDDNMAALALIKRGEAIRAELHLRLADAGRDELTAQIAKAQASYQEALDRKPSNPALAAAAQFGLGLCEEELGNFDKAAEIYRAVAQKPEYTGAVAKAAAEYRLKTMDDFKAQIVFKPAPPQPQVSLTPQATTPTIQLPAGDANAPAVIQAPNAPSAAPAAPTGPAEVTPAPATPPAAAEANKPAGG